MKEKILAKDNLKSTVQFFMTFVILIITFIVSRSQTDFASDWNYIFLLVVGYYFNDRIEINSKSIIDDKLNSIYLKNVNSQLRFQFILALLLLIGLIILLIESNNSEYDYNTWLAATLLALGFFFKKRELYTGQVHLYLNASLAIISVIGLLVIVLINYQKSNTIDNIELIPTSYLPAILIVVIFYFKEKNESNDPLIDKNSKSN